ncbi:MAG TPA: hypothetical protein VKW09_16010 [bacterium]|nr:hypothetical protein [bacterium]
MMIQGGKGGTTYSWVIGPITRKIYCYKSSRADQVVSKFWEADGETAYHDADLVNATKEINAILSKVERGNGDPDRQLSLVIFKNRPFLVWASYEIVGPDDDEATIAKALKLKIRESRQRRSTRRR